MTRYYVPVVLVVRADTERAADAEAVRALDTMQHGQRVEGYILPDCLKNSPASDGWHDVEQVLRDCRIEEVQP